jgi:hypothetical protein
MSRIRSYAARVQTSARDPKQCRTGTRIRRHCRPPPRPHRLFTLPRLTILVPMLAPLRAAPRPVPSFSSLSSPSLSGSSAGAGASTPTRSSLSRLRLARWSAAGVALCSPALRGVRTGALCRYPEPSFVPATREWHAHTQSTRLQDMMWYRHPRFRRRRSLQATDRPVLS